MRRTPAIVVASSLVLAPCALGRDPARTAWTADWNRRIDVARTPFEHPCATKAFIAWADPFLAGCEPDSGATPSDCDARLVWVEARVDQCRAWTAWQLRNFNKHERTDGVPPSMRIE